MKNVEKILTAMEKVFSGHKVEISTNYNARIGCVFIDDVYVGAFEDGFLNKDFDNPEIEIKVKAPLYKIKDFLEEVECDGVFYHAVERGFKEWEEGLQQNS